MHCEGDKIAGYDFNEPCYSKDACPGCYKCIITCIGCENCSELEDQKVRQAEVGDYVVIHQKVILDIHWKGKWSGAMDEGIGRVGYIAAGNPRDGYKLKFTTTNTKILDHFVWPAGCLRLAMVNDNTTDKLIKQVKEKDVNTNL